MIPSEDGPKASVRVSKETEPARAGQYGYSGSVLLLHGIFIYMLTVYQVLEAHSDRLDLRYVFHGCCCCCWVFWYSWILSGYIKERMFVPAGTVVLSANHRYH